ncbi:MAG: OmpA family protein, partial [Bacteroidales bacterium]|nr:OmpA family protein [Bacteroidales bacterium]
VHWYWETSRGNSNGEYDIALPANEWNHVAISFNKRAWKVYFNGIRVANVPNVLAPPGWLLFELDNGNGDTYITNLRIAKGAVPLYDRMMSEGKFVTYGITFDVGKATIKPESMGEINRIVQLMNENPSLRFSVEGHTDSTGNATSNQTLSEQRSQAIVDKLVELGIAKDRLTAVGKGQNSPIADNTTDEGRAKNRRVEFVKI